MAAERRRRTGWQTRQFADPKQFATEPATPPGG